MAGSQDPSLQDSLLHQKGTLVGVWSAALGQGVGVEEGEGVEGQSVMPNREGIKKTKTQGQEQKTASRGHKTISLGEGEGAQF